MVNISFDDGDEFDLDKYDRACQARVKKGKSKKKGISFSVEEWLKLDFHDACELNGIDWNDWLAVKLKEFLDEYGLEVVLPRMAADIGDRQNKYEIAKAMLEIKGSARLKIAKKFIDEKIMKLTRYVSHGEIILRDAWTSEDVEKILIEAGKRYTITADEACSILQNKVKYMESDDARKRMEEAIYNVLQTKDLSNKDKMILGFKPNQLPGSNNGKVIANGHSHD